ncbi:energy-coupling factor transporter transmembrane component T family protein [Arthrobacter sp. NIO-1057]|uniref:energy-coupling factor transporter transmembrane component T family protein n=1 Tax=Arthrobacter sp. NIO-1057 TaxID=993071 RepID=UPI00071D7CD5|nr:energy-coupling factor transporter transmembrane component T [Arthrobacter sp. NIO-1057]KSU65986.1 ABC transporter permease [Arthrobacter sp. NIO-1057]SCC29254.1 energy-coupling factor transport system permease protein [Arthrobacter sp. NIO-1057]
MPRTIHLHPFTILAVAVAVVSTTTAASQWWLSCAVLGLCLLISGWAGQLKKLSVLSGAMLLPTLLSLLLIHGLVSRDNSPAIAQWGPVRVTVHGLEVALSLGLRTAVLVVVGLLCGLLIDKHQLVAAIDLSPVPPQLGYLLAATHFLLPQMGEKQRRIGEAQTLRRVGTGKGVTGWFQRVRLRAVPLVLASMQDAQDRAVHLSARGFPAIGTRTRLRTVPDSSAQRAIRWIAIVVAVLGPVLILVLAQLGSKS